MKKIIKRFRIITVFIIVILLAIFFYFQNNSLSLSTYNYQSKKIPSDLDNLVIINVSDLHNKEFGMENEKLIKMIIAEQPDLITITGDMIDRTSTNVDVAITLAKKLVDIAPVYYITGNHERGIRIADTGLYNEFERGLEDAGVIFLKDEVVEFSDHFYIAGLDDTLTNPNVTVSHNSFLGDNISSEDFVLLLAHEPQALKDYAEADYDLVLSGHAHGGQFRIPLTNIGLIAPDQGFFPKYTAGGYTINDTTMYVSRGLGNSIIPIRIFNEPDLVKVVLQCKIQ